MSLLNVTTLQSKAALTPVLIKDSNGTEIGQLCKAWCCLNGLSAPATIRAGFNVSSVTDNGVGTWTINMTNALADTSYAVVALGGYNNNNDLTTRISTVNTSSAFTIGTVQAGTGWHDHDYIGVVVFR
jgi:hypothetical protein